VVPNVNGRGFVDLPRGMFFRHATGQRKTKKRQPPVRLTPRLLAHMRRWGRLGIARHAVIEWNGKPVKSVRKAFTAAVIAAGLDPQEVTPHVLRHACGHQCREAARVRHHDGRFLHAGEGREDHYILRDLAAHQDPHRGR
jgi:integrase